MEFAQEALDNLVEIARLDSIAVARAILTAIDAIEFSTPEVEGWSIVRFGVVGEHDVATFRLPPPFRRYEVSIIEQVIVAVRQMGSPG